MKSQTSLKKLVYFQTRRLQWRAEKSRQRMLLHGKRGRIGQFSVSPLRCHVHGTLQAQKRGPPRLVHAPLFKRRPQLHWPDWGAQSGSGKTSILHGRHAGLRISNGNFSEFLNPNFWVIFLVKQDQKFNDFLFAFFRQFGLVSNSIFYSMVTRISKGSRKSRKI